MTDTAVRCRDLRINLGGKDVVDGIDLDVTPGDWVAVVGPNGSRQDDLDACPRWIDSVHR